VESLTATVCDEVETVGTEEAATDKGPWDESGGRNGCTGAAAGVIDGLHRDLIREGWEEGLPDAAAGSYNEHLGAKMRDRSSRTEGIGIRRRGKTALIDYIIQKVILS